MPKLIAKEKFYYAGRNLEAGQEFEAEQQDVALLTNSVSPRARVPASTESTEIRAMSTTDTGDLLDQGKQPRRYNRRDLRAKV